MAINVDSARAHALRSWRFTRRTGIQEAVVVVIAFIGWQTLMNSGRQDPPDIVGTVGETLRDT